MAIAFHLKKKSVVWTTKTPCRPSYWRKKKT